MLVQIGRVDLGSGTLMSLDVAARIVLNELDDLIGYEANNGSVGSERWQQIGDEAEQLHALTVSALQGS